MCSDKQLSQETEARCLRGAIRGTEKTPSKIVLGTHWFSHRKKKKIFSLLDYALEKLNINCLDTARAYGFGASEQVIGEWLKTIAQRNEILIQTKIGHPSSYSSEHSRLSAKELSQDLSESLSALKTDRVDFLLLHRDLDRVPAGELVDIMNEFVQLNLTTTIGVSNWSLKRINEANSYALKNGKIPFTVSSPQFSLATPIGAPWPGSEVVSGEEELEWYRVNNIAVFAWSALAEGFFSSHSVSSSNIFPGKLLRWFDRRNRVYHNNRNLERLKRARELASSRGVSVAQIAIAFVLCQDFPVFAVTSTKSRPHLRESSIASNISLSASELKWLYV